MVPLAELRSSAAVSRASKTASRTLEMFSIFGLGPLLPLLLLVINRSRDSTSDGLLKLAEEIRDVVTVFFGSGRKAYACCRGDRREPQN